MLTDNDVAFGESALSPVGALVPSRFIDPLKLIDIANSERRAYQSAKPFPHTVIDGFFPAPLLDLVIAGLPSNNDRWTAYNNPNERKRVFSDANSFAPAAETFAHALNSLPMISFLEKLTGIDGIIPDPYLHAAGYMKVEPGGFLNLHKDFTMHSHLALERRINVLVYLNKDWRPEWGGQLELHSNDNLQAPGHVELQIEPVFNRMVIFNTPDALHGHRRPVACPPDRARLLFSCFYFTVPPIMGYRSLAKKVDFPGQNSLSRTAIKIANRVLPPFFFDMFRSRRR